MKPELGRTSKFLASVAGHPITPDMLRRIVAENDKQRFALTPDGAFIRAQQGHSIDALHAGSV